MVDNGSAQSMKMWPLPKFYFLVEWDSVQLSFQEVSGLDIEAQTIEYRHGDSPQYSAIKMPGIQTGGNVTMKKGLIKTNSKFWDWFNEIKMNIIKRKTVTIKLLGEDGSPKMTWTLENAWPTKITAADMKSDKDEVAIETLEIAHEGIAITNS